MLVLSRSIEQSIVIAGNITVKVVAIRGGQVKLGITAPEEVSVHREEVQERVEKEGVRRGG